MAEALCNACEMVVFWTQSELSPNRSNEGTLEYVDRVSERLSRLEPLVLPSSSPDMSNPRS
jgi:hypothetical protein